MLMFLQVLGQIVKSLGKKCNLHFGGTGVALAGRVLGNDLLLYSGIEGHDSPSWLLRGAPGQIHPGSIKPRPFLRHPPDYQDLLATPNATRACSTSAVICLMSASIPSNFVLPRKRFVNSKTTYSS